MTSPLPELVTQAQWAQHLGVSAGTFLRWRRHGVKTRLSGVIEIPAPVDLPGWPRWKREDVLRISRLLINGKRRLFARVDQGALQSRASRPEQVQRASHGSLVSRQSVDQLHDANDSEALTGSVVHSLDGAR